LHFTLFPCFRRISAIYSSFCLIFAAFVSTSYRHDLPALPQYYTGQYAAGKLGRADSVRTNHTTVSRASPGAVRQIHQRGTVEPSKVSRHFQGGQTEHLPLLRQRMDAHAERRRVSGGARVCQSGQSKDRGMRWQKCRRNG
uniref:Uncharacterized protein n=1 Tax=Anopheles atroparvus TaxID=41427 RepID=A0A182IJY1_ANOAO